MYKVSNFQLNIILFSFQLNAIFNLFSVFKLRFLLDFSEIICLFSIYQFIHYFYHVYFNCSNTLYYLRPQKAPGFAYAWLELISHRVFLGRVLAHSPAQKVINYLNTVYIFRKIGIFVKTFKVKIPSLFIPILFFLSRHLKNSKFSTGYHYLMQLIYPMMLYLSKRKLNGKICNRSATNILKNQKYIDNVTANILQYYY